MPITLFLIAALVFSAILHEYAHGWAAHRLGDDTAKNAGRLTLNPLAHLDPVGSLILPLFLILSKSGFIIAWAKPVPYNPYNLRDPKYGDLKVAIAGPGTNFILALIFGLIARFAPLATSAKSGIIFNFFQGNNDFILNQINVSLGASVFVLSFILCFINLLLMIFNLIPVPPLDGSKILTTFLPGKLKIIMYKAEPYGIFIVLFLLILGIFSFIWPLIIFALSLIIGV